MKGGFLCTVLAFALFVPSGAFSQAPPSGALRWAEGAPNATSEVKDNNKIEGLKTDDVHVFVSLADLKDTEYNRVWVQIANHSKAPLNFDPQSAVLINQKDKVVRAEDPEKAAKSVQKFGEAKSQELSSAHCNNIGAVQCQPTNTQMQMSKQVAAFTSQQAQWIKDNALTQKTLAPGEDVQGIIMFKKEKKAANYILRVPVAGQTFEFPLSAQNKIPSYD
ncbi:MAG: hypothetical protein WAN03_08015 [Candidatus Sulfotelmatobacter sp.]